MVQVSPSPPLRKSGKDALLRGRSPDSRPKYLPTLRAFPSIWDSGFFVADFVAVHSCEGSGGITPLFPLTSGASWLSKRKVAKSTETLAVFPVKRSEFQQVDSIYEAGIDGMGRGGELDSKEDKRPRSPV